MYNYRELLNFSSNWNPNLLNLVYTACVVLVLWLLHILLVRIVLRRTHDVHSRYVWKKSVTYGTVFLGIVIVSLIWFFTDIRSTETFLGLLSAGIAIALKDIIVNFAGWIFIMAVRPLSVGDRIQIGAFSGDVIDIGIFHISLMEIGNWIEADQSTGRVIKIPNGFLFSQALANYSRGFQYIWNELRVLVTFESNWEKAKKLLLDIAQRRTEHLTAEAEQRVREAGRRFLIYYTKLTPIVYTTVKDSGVLLTIRYLTKPRERRGTEEGIWEDILKAFASCDDIDFAYPTTRFYDNSAEGKEGKKGKKE